MLLIAYTISGLSFTLLTELHYSVNHYSQLISNSLLIFLADQHGEWDSISYWVDFLESPCCLFFFLCPNSDVMLKLHPGGKIERISKLSPCHLLGTWNHTSNSVPEGSLWLKGNIFIYWSNNAWATNPGSWMQLLTDNLLVRRAWIHLPFKACDARKWDGEKVSSLSRLAYHEEAGNRKCRKENKRKVVSAFCVLKHTLSTHNSQKEVGLVVLLWGDGIKDYTTQLFFLPLYPKILLLLLIDPANSSRTNWSSVTYIQKRNQVI